LRQPARQHGGDNTAGDRGRRLQAVDRPQSGLDDAKPNEKNLIRLRKSEGQPQWLLSLQECMATLPGGNSYSQV